MGLFARLGFGTFAPKRKPLRRARRLLLILEELESRALPSLMGNALFPADNPWNEKITNAPVAANSATLINSIGANTSLHPDFGTTYGGALNGIPVNFVTATQPKINVVVDAYASESDLIPVPIPANAVIEGDPLPSAQNTGDRHLLVFDQTNNLEYELFNASRPSENTDGQWHCSSLAFWNMNQDWFRPTGYTSADAAGLPILPGLVRPDEVLTQKVITHALRFTVNRSANTFIFPASHEAGSNNANLPPMGARFRLKASFDISHYSAADQVILQALKDYGMIVADNGSSWYLSGEPSPSWNDSDLHSLTQVIGSDFETVDLTPKLTSATAATALTPGSVITLTGLNFSGGAGKTVVNFGSIPAASVQVVSDTEILATVGVVPTGSNVTAQVTSPYSSSAAVSLQLNNQLPPQSPVLVAPVGAIQSATPTFTWNAATGAAYYDVWVNDTTTGQAQVVRNQDVSGTSLSASLTPGHAYQWWVRGFNASGMAGAWSVGASFNIALPVIVPIGPVGLLATATPAFSWTAAIGASYYDLWVDDATTGQAQVVRNAHVVGTSLVSPVVLAPTHSYQWWVRAFFAGGTATAWSSTTQFTITPLGMVTPTAPTGSVSSAMPVFTWSGVAGADYYDVWVNNLTSGQSQVLRNSRVTGTSWTATSALTPGLSYQWWVRAFSNNGDWSTWGSGATFTVAFLATPVPIGPTGSGAGTRPMLSWTGVAGGDYYDVWVNELTSGKSQVLRNAHILGTSLTGSLTTGHGYQWWVRALSNNGDYSMWSNPLTFTA